MTANLLIMFIKNSVPGKVKTRLAKDIGDDRALDVYIRMLEHIRTVTGILPFDKSIYYSDFIETDDVFESDEYDKFLQMGEDQGERMYQAFSHAFDIGYKRVIIICSDCFELTHSHIIDAFESLREVDVVIGPSTDGGYYLLGTRQMYPVLFQNKAWGTENVFLDTLIDMKHHAISFRLLETLSDIDTFEDLKRTGRFPDVTGDVE